MSKGTAVAGGLAYIAQRFASYLNRFSKAAYPILEWQLMSVHTAAKLLLSS